MAEIGTFDIECPACGETLTIPVHLGSMLHVVGKPECKVSLAPDWETIEGHVARCPGPWDGGDGGGEPLPVREACA